MYLVVSLQTVLVRGLISTLQLLVTTSVQAFFITGLHCKLGPTAPHSSTSSTCRCHSYTCTAPAPAIFTSQFCTCTSSCAVSGRLTGRLTHFLAGTGWQENTWLEVQSSHCRHSCCQAGRHTGRGTCRHCCRYGAAYEV